MSQSHSRFVCQQCGYSQVGWAGKCPNCNSWGSMVETVEIESRKKSTNSSNKGVLSGNKPQNLISINTSKRPRIPTKSTELDRVLGGGIVSGQVSLIAGEPGIGKSTLLLQLANKLGGALYVSGEESSFQIATRAQRLGIKCKTIEVFEETDIDNVVIQITSLAKPPTVVIVDSIQTMSTSDLSGLAGSVGQVRECTFRLVRVAKQKGIPIFIVGHVTKEGTVAGPAVLAHIVDTVLWFEGDKTLQLRLVRAVKNRFGPTDEVGIFEMTEKGLTSLTNADRIFLSQGTKAVSGSVISSTLQGTRPILVEIQSLTTPVKSAFPKRIAQGIDPKRLELLIAILIKRVNLPLYDYDVFVNVTGGIRLEENACDLAVALSIASSFYDKPLPKRTIAVGELGLLGEIREVVAEEKRIREAKRLGFTFPVSSKYKYLSQATKTTLGRK